MNFAGSEYELRLDRARKLMDKNHFSALLVTGLENYAYFTGVPIGVYNPYRPWAAIIPLDGEPSIVASTVLTETNTQESFYQNICQYPGRPEQNLAKSLASQMKEMHLESGKIGCEFSANLHLGIPIEIFEELRQTLPSCEFLDGSSVFWILRSIKSPAERSLIKKACDITGKARQEAFSAMKEGMTEEELARVFARQMIEHGAAKPFFIYVNSGVFHSLAPCPNRKLAKGEIVWVDGGASYNDYLCDYNRIAVVGKPSARQHKFHREIVDATSRAIRLIHPGQRFSEVYQICKSELESSERSLQISLDLDNRTQHLGHSQGMEVTEFPFVAPYDHAILEEGMVFSLEPGIMGKEGVFIWEEVLEVSKSGVNLLSEETSDLIQI